MSRLFYAVRWPPTSMLDTWELTQLLSVLVLMHGGASVVVADDDGREVVRLNRDQMRNLFGARLPDEP